MRLFLGPAIIVGALALGGSANAQNYPWCAEYGGGDMGGATNCGFSTYEQCMATLSGMGGFCNRNTQYVPQPGAHSVTPYAPRHHRRHEGY